MWKDQESAGRGGNRLAVLKDRVSVHWRVLRLAETKRAVLITAFGRNVSPAWLEDALTDGTPIRRARLSGDGEAGLRAVLECDGDPDEVAAAVERVNATLPDYARVRWFRITRAGVPEETLPWVSMTS